MPKDKKEAHVPVRSLKTRDSLVYCTFDALENKKYVASGEFADVYLAKWNHRNVAVKILKEKYRGQEGPNFDFDAEKEILAKLPSFPGIVKMYSNGEHQELPFMVLECLGDTLSQRMYRSSRALPWTVVFDFAKQLASTMKYLHSEAVKGHTVLHRDLKPDNIMFDETGSTLKLVDFGLVCVVNQATNSAKKSANQAGLDGSSSAKIDGETLLDLTGRTGSLRYMAPEVAGNKPYNEKAEVYTWAIILWEMTVRERPYTGLNPTKFVEYVMDRGYRPDLKHKRCKQWPPEIHDLVANCFSGTISDRPSFTEVYELLDSLEKGGTIVDQAPGCACTVM